MMLPLENSFATHFLMTSSRVFFEERLISSRFLDTLRIILNPYASLPEDTFHLQQDQNLWRQFFDGKEDIAVFVSSWFGTQSLESYRLSYMMEKSLQEIIKVLAEIGALLTERSKLFFNRSVFVSYQQSRSPQEKRLLSSIINDYTTLLASLLESLINNKKTCASLYLRSSSLENYSKINEKIASDLGLKGLKPLNSFFYDYLTFKQTVLVALSEVSESGRFFLDALGLYGDKSIVWQMIALFQSLKNELYKFSLSSHSELSDGFEWDLYIKNEVNTLALFSEKLSDLKNLFTAFFTSIVFEDCVFDLLESEKLDLKNHLLQSGCCAKDAENAVTKLLRYCLFHETKVDLLLPAELEKIHPALKALDWHVVISFFQKDPLSLKQTYLKEQNALQINHLKAGFQKILSQSILITFFCLFVFSACGVKTTPKNPLEDKRVPIPFRISI